MTLIERLESAKTGSRELDAEIVVKAGYGLPSPIGDENPVLRLPSEYDLSRNCVDGQYWLEQRSGMSLRTAPSFSTSIDAALTLVPEDWSWSVDDYQGTCKAHLDKLADGKAAIFDCFCATPALALCIAALKAREQTNDAD